MQVPCPSSYISLYSAERFDFDESALTAEVPVKGATGNGTVQTYISVIAPATGDKVEIWRAGPNIGMYEKTGGVVTSNTYVPYDEAAMRWWRIRDDGGDVLWETSPDGETWTTLRRKQLAIERSGVAVQLGCGYWGSETNPDPGAVRQRLDRRAGPRLGRAQHRDPHPARHRRLDVRARGLRGRVHERRLRARGRTRPSSPSSTRPAGGSCA